MTATQTTTHATCVAYGNAALLITGASGTGKSSLALALIGLGATLIADDQVILKNCEGVLIAHCPSPISGMIEARGVGLLSAPVQDSAILTHVVDLNQTEPDRLPPWRQITILGVEVPLVFGKDSPNLTTALNHLMRNGRAK